MTQSKQCPECGRSNLYTAVASSGGGYAPNYLPGLGTFWCSAKFKVMLCQDCGLTRFFAEPESLTKVSSSHKWKRVP